MAIKQKDNGRLAAFLRGSALVLLASSLVIAALWFGGWDNGGLFGPHPDEPDNASDDYGVQTQSTTSATIREEAMQRQIARVPEEESCLVVRFLSVGQGDCALVSCQGRYLLIDGGPRSASQKVYTVLKTLGVGHLDIVIATHPDADHIAGISAALNAASCDVCYSPVEAADTRTFESMSRYVNESGARLIVPEIPSSLQLGDAVVELIGPVGDYDESDNNKSIVCRVVYGNTSFMFAGDAEREAEADLVRSGVDLAADVLKVGHHGSSRSSSDAFVSAVGPRLAIISVGADNSYEHPTSQTLDTLARYQVEVLRTDLDGDITVVSNGETLSFFRSKGA